MANAAVKQPFQTRMYTAQEKARLLEEVTIARASGETEEAVCNRLGVSRATIHKWRGIVEGGGVLTDSPTPSEAGKMSARVRSKNKITDAQRLAVAHAILAGKDTAKAAAQRLKRSESAVHCWVRNVQEGLNPGFDRTQARRLRREGKLPLPPDNVAYRHASPLPKPTPLAHPPEPAPQQLEIGHFTPRGELDALKARVVELESENKRLRAKLKQLVPMLIDD